MKYFLHTTRSGKTWVNTTQESERLPMVGEFVVIKSEEEEEWYQVDLVVHVTFPAQYQAEVYATEFDHDEFQKKVIALDEA